MIFAISCWVFGGGFFISSTLNDPQTVQHQIVQFLGYTCASVFIVGGFILFQLDKLINKDKIKLLKN